MAIAIESTRQLTAAPLVHAAADDHSRRWGPPIWPADRAQPVRPNPRGAMPVELALLSVLSAFRTD